MILGVCSLIFSVIAFIFAVYSVIQVEAMKRSTHQVTYINPMEQNFDHITGEDKNRFMKEDETLENLN